jgi:pyruvate ferredoxin oxidoreductase gamma subunit
MYRIRFHGRGGQGIKTASRILGTALFLEGFEVQDAPRYGAERRGAPIFAYVRAAHEPIHERGVIHRPDLVVVADDTLLTITPAQVLEGMTSASVVLIYSIRPESWWRKHWPEIRQMVVLEPIRDTGAGLPAGIFCAGAAAALLGTVSEEALVRAVEEELAAYDSAVVTSNRQAVLAAYRAVDTLRGLVRSLPPLSVAETAAPAWIDLSRDAVEIAAPVIHAGTTSRLVRTGLWRTRRPVIDKGKCRRCLQCCAWCPEGAILVGEDGFPVIDYEHCKGCLVCAAQCPFKAIRGISEAQAKEEQDAQTADRK